MMLYVLGGVGAPKIELKTKQVVNLPAPNGSARKGIEVYRFEPDLLDEYRSEGDVDVEVGKKFKFRASLTWVRASKQVLFDLFKAWAQGDFTFWPHVDYDLSFKSKVEDLKFDYFEGFLNHPAGYTIQLELIGIEYLAGPGMGSLETAAGYGTHWGEDVEFQSP